MKATPSIPSPLRGMRDIQPLHSCSERVKANKEYNAGGRSIPPCQGARRRSAK